MKKAAKDRQRAATGDQLPQELYSQSRFLGVQADDGGFAGDTYPELGPMLGMADLGVHAECERRVAVLADAVERERATIALLEAKCEEYLAQLQRSADIIEAGRDREDRERARLADRADELEQRLAAERDRRLAAEDERDHARHALERLKDEKGDDHAEMDKARDSILKKDAAFSDLKAKAAELETEVATLRAELTVTRGERSRADNEIVHLKREIEALERSLRNKEGDLHRLDAKDENSKHLVSQQQERIAELKDENHLLKQDKEKLFSKVDHLLYENENLRNEIFMVKKIMLEVEKRDLQVGTLVYENLRKDDRPARKDRDHRHPVDPDLEQLRNRPERRRR